MENTSGFYKLIEDQLLFAPTAVLAPEYSLMREEYNTYTYPVDGWYWFDSDYLAKEFWNIAEYNVDNIVEE